MRQPEPKRLPAAGNGEGKRDDGSNEDAQFYSSRAEPCRIFNYYTYINCNQHCLGMIVKFQITLSSTEGEQ